MEDNAEEKLYNEHPARVLEYAKLKKTHVQAGKANGMRSNVHTSNDGHFDSLKPGLPTYFAHPDTWLRFGVHEGELKEDYDTRMNRIVQPI